jgi:DNA-binding NarL/FixJ family response regulator
LVDDHRILREGLRAILNAQTDFVVVGEAHDGREAIRRAQELKPDVVVLDLSMPRMNGLEALSDIKRVAPGARVLILTAHKEDEYVLGALKAGADAFVCKDAGAGELAVGVRCAASGKRYLSAEVATPLGVAALDGGKPAAQHPAGDRLSKRELEVLKLVAEGYRSRQIAEYLCISEKTVEKHRASLMRKLRVTNVSGLTARAIEKGLVSR